MRKPLLTMKIIYEDEDIIVVDKPGGLITIRDAKTPENETLYHQVYEHVNQTSRGRIFIVHRLDKDTSGIIIFAKTGVIKELLQKQFELQKVERKYEALVEGRLSKPEDRLKIHLITDKFNNVFASKRGGDLAITDYRVIKSNDEKSYLDISILTGKRNQIRASLAFIGHPIIGDRKYESSVKGHLCLRAYELRFSEDIGLQKSCFSTWKKYENYFED